MDCARAFDWGDIALALSLGACVGMTLVAAIVVWRRG